MAKLEITVIDETQEVDPGINRQLFFRNTNPPTEVLASLAERPIGQSVVGACVKFQYGKESKRIDIVGPQADWKALVGVPVHESLGGVYTPAVSEYDEPDYGLPKITVSAKIVD